MEPSRPSRRRPKRVGRSKNAIVMVARADAPLHPRSVDPRQAGEPAEGLSRCACRHHRGRRIIVVRTKAACSVRSLTATVEANMSEKIYDVPAEWAKCAFVDEAKYKEMYGRSVSNSDGFWAEQAKRVGWMKPFTKVENTSFAPGDISIKWFEDGVLNVAWNCIDRHLEKRGDQTAIIWEGDNPSDSKHITYRQLHDEVCRFANILRTRNVKKGDRVTIYLPMIPEAAYAMLACARIGAIHSVVFAGFSPDSLAQRITDCQSKVVITADEGLRGGKKVALKANVDAAIAKAGGVDWVVVVKRTGAPVEMDPVRDFWYHDAAEVVTTECPCEPLHAEDPLCILYTSGSTGQPKGVLHTTGGYLVWAAMTHQYVFDYHDGDIYWCTADVAWVPGHTYILSRPRVGHRPPLHPLRPARQRRHDPDVRGHPDLPLDLALLGGRRHASGQHLLHGADGDPLADAGRRGAGAADLAPIAAPPRLGRRADQPGGLGVVPPGRRRRPLPDRRHLVADRDRRHPDHAAAGRDSTEAGLGDEAVLRRQAAGGRRGGQGARGRLRGQSLHRR